ncbi:MAG: hypothetical protein ACFCU5_16910 [Pleurocapsa sp.]
MNKIISPGTDSSFQANQIICLEYQDTCVYGEVIQIIEQRQLCWFRPFLLTKNNSGDRDDFLKNEIMDLRASSDLLLPVCWFRASLDTEAFCLLSKFGDLDYLPKDNSNSRRYLNQFVRQVWQAHQDKF